MKEIEDDKSQAVDAEAYIMSILSRHLNKQSAKIADVQANSPPIPLPPPVLKTILARAKNAKVEFVN